MSLTVSQANERIQRLKSQLANYKENAKKAARTGVGAALVVGGGFAGGVIDAKIGAFDTPGGKVEPSAALGGLMISAAMLGLVGDDETLSDGVALLGAGMLAGHGRELGKSLAA